MNPPKFYVGYPKGWITKRPWLHEDNVALFKNIKKILKEYGYVYTIGKIKTVPKNYDIVLAHHTTMKRKNVWNLKKGYLPGYINWDKTGYSGWAEIADSKELFKKSQQVNFDIALQVFNDIAKEYIENDTSKFPQKKIPQMKTSVLPDSGKFIPPKSPYVFVACQRPRDTVSKLAKIKTEILPVEVVKAFKATKYKVVIKRHPQEKLMDITYLAKEPHVIFSQHSIHQIIPNAKAVITVNSGVGFEALLHKKPVYTAGHCDYHWVTRPLKNIGDIKRIVNTLDNPIDEEKIVKFMHFMLTEYFVNAYDINSVKKKIDMCVKEWRIK
jgi:hypothetical protein